MPSSLAGHAVNPSAEAPWRHPCRHGSGNRRGQRTKSWSVTLKACPLLGFRWEDAPNSRLSGERTSCTACSQAHRPSRLVLVRLPSRDLERHGCRARASMDGFTACPATVGGQGLCSQAAKLGALNLTYRTSGKAHAAIQSRSCVVPVQLAHHRGGPCAAWMSLKRLQERIHGVSRNGGQTRALQPSHNARRSTPELSRAKLPKAHAAAASSRGVSVQPADYLETCGTDTA